jgi:hypothetical protein
VKKSRDEKVGEGMAILINNESKFTEKVGMYDCNGKVEMCATENIFGQERILIMFCYMSPLVVV